MSKHSTRQTLHQAQQGLVSIIVTMMFISIITAITISILLIMRREQRQALDRQLSMQAFYAAESGINDTVAKLKSNTPPPEIKDCKDTNKISSGDLSGDGVLKYTCVLLDKSPNSLEYSAIDTGASTVVPIDGGSIGIKKLKISWNDADGGNTFVPTPPATNESHLLPQDLANVANLGETANLNTPTGTGILRATLMPIKTPIVRSELISAAKTYFLYPKGSGPSDGRVQPGGESNPRFVDGDCNVVNQPKYCNVILDNLLATGTNRFYLRLRSIYRRSAVTITAYDAFGNVVPLQGAQAVVDATGKANDVLRRIQVRVPIKTNYTYPEFALATSDSICKLLAVWSGGADSVLNQMPDEAPGPAGTPEKTYYDKAKDQVVCALN
jgi:hypothetical protein